MHKKDSLIWSARLLFYIGIITLPFPILKIYKNLLVFDVLVLLGFILILFDISYNRAIVREIFSNHVFLIPVLVLSIGFFISVINSHFIIESITGYLQIIFIFCFIFPIIQFLFDNRNKVKKGVLFLGIGTALLTVTLFIFTLITGPEYAKATFMVLQKGWGGGRVSFGGLVPNFTARIIIQGVPIYIIFFLKNNNKFIKLINFLLIIFAIYVVVQTGSRSGLIVICSILVLLPLFLYRLNFNVKILISLVFLTIIILLYNLAFNNEFLNHLGRFKSIFEIYSSRSSIQRLSLLKQGINDIFQNPIFGVGLENSIYYLKENVPVHNPLILTWMENGIFGFLGYILIYSLLIYYVMKSYFNKFFKDTYLMGFTLIVISMIIGDMFMANSYRRIFWVPCLFYINYFQIVFKEYKE